MSQIAICIVTNRINDKSFVFKSKDPENRWDRFKKQLDNHSFYNKNLQDDWNNFDSDAFLFDVKEYANEENIDEIFIKTIELQNKRYNELDYTIFLNKSLDSTIIKLKNDLEEKIKSSDFKIFINKYQLKESDILKFKQEMIQKIESGEINYNNFDEEFDISFKRKEKEIKNNEILSLLYYSNNLNNSNLVQFNLSNSDLENIKSEIKELITNKELKSQTDVLDKFRSLANEKYEKNKYKNKCYTFLNDLMGNDYYKNMFKANKISNDDITSIKNTVISLIDKNEISLEGIEDKVNELLIEKSSENEPSGDDKNQLRNNAFKIIGNEKNINITFKNRLKDVYLHENIAYVILIKILRSINAGEITNTMKLNLVIDNIIKEEEKKDIYCRLYNLSSSQLSILLKKNKIYDFSLNKQSKIDKLLFSVSPSVLRNNIRNLGQPLNIRYVENPFVQYCPECGFKVDIEEEDFCTNCGYDLITDENKCEGKGKGGDKDDGVDVEKPKRTFEFILTLIAFILTIFGILIVLINSNYYSVNILDALLFSIIGLFSTIIIRNYPRIGAIIAIVAGFFIFFIDVPFGLIILLLYIISAVLCFARN